ncbi:MAG TPA: hypothetical protein VF159_02510 [Gemmatimonadaceae bacterium]
MRWFANIITVIALATTPVFAQRPNPSAARLWTHATAEAFLWAVDAGGVGMLMDESACGRRHRGESVGLFSPCFMYAGAAASIGWFGGATIGATYGASGIAQERGCAREASILRSFGGALLGVVPGAVAALTSHGRYPPPRTFLVMTVPLAAAGGAAIASSGCTG